MGAEGANTLPASHSAPALGGGLVPEGGGRCLFVSGQTWVGHSGFKEQEACARSHAIVLFGRASAAVGRQYAGRNKADQR